MVRIVENAFIPLKDGVKLAARVWLPDNAGLVNQVPAIFEFLPYRKRDYTASRDEITYQTFAQNGYAGVRVDLRGCGDSSGYKQDEYVLQEQLDAVECIKWIRGQSWCTGKIGMMGYSWGGFNSLQVAYHAPDALNAILPVGFADDRYGGDVHFRGGVMMVENVTWGAGMEMRYSFPPDPLITTNWKEVYLDRLDNLEPISTKWMVHPLRDEYWKHASICEDPERIKAPTLMMAGLFDAYSNNILPTLEGLSCPKRAILGPWLHLYPHAMPSHSMPWPFCSEAIKWWDKWLKEIETPSDEPELLVYLQNRDPAVPQAAQINGEWICDFKTENKVYFMTEGMLGEQRGNEKIDFHTSEACGFIGSAPTYPDRLAEIQGEQSADDMMSCYFETPPMVEETHFCGNPVVSMSIASDKPVASVFVRLCKVNEKGYSIVLSYTAWNLTHDVGHEIMRPLIPGDFKEVHFKLHVISETIPKGSRLRLCFSSSLFPVFIPNPESTTFTLELSKCRLSMPEITEKRSYEKSFGAVSDCVPQDTIILEKPYHHRKLNTDSETGRVGCQIRSSIGKKKFGTHGLVTEWRTESMYSILPDDPTSATIHQTHEAQWSRGDDWVIDIITTMDFTLDKDHYYTHETRAVKHNHEILFSREYDNKYGRQPTSI